MRDSKICALIPLRGGSKSIEKKNIKPIAGKPLCAWVLESAANAKHIDKIYVSTDCPEIKAAVDVLGLDVEVIQRPAEFATDEASTESVILHFIKQVPCDVVVTIQATSPLLTSVQLDKAIMQFDTHNLDSMLTAVRFKRFFWTDKGQAINYDPLNRPRRQDFEGTLMENGAFYITKNEILERYKCRLGGKIGIFEMPDNSAVEIDEPQDWAVVEQLLIRN